MRYKLLEPKINLDIFLQKKRRKNSNCIFLAPSRTHKHEEQNSKMKKNCDKLLSYTVCKHQLSVYIYSRETSIPDSQGEMIYITQTNE